MGIFSNWGSKIEREEKGRGYQPTPEYKKISQKFTN